MKIHRVPVFLLCLLAGCSQPEDAAPQGRVLIQSQLPQRAELPRRIRAYGTATASSGGRVSLSKAVDGQVTRMLVTAGESVRKGQPLLEFHLAATAASALEQAGTALKAARADQARIARLLDDNLATRDQKTQADKALADAQAAFAAASQDAGGAQVRQMLSAPFDGVVDALLVAQGDRVAANTGLLALTQQQGLVVVCGVEPAEAAQVVPGQKAVLAPLNGGAVLAGTVQRVGKVLNDKTRLLDVEIGSRSELIRGQAYQAGIEAGVQSGWQVPAAAVLDDEQGAYLFQVKGATARRVGVQRLDAGGGKLLVEGPLLPNLPVVTAGAYQLSDGALVRSAASAAATEARP